MQDLLMTLHFLGLFMGGASAFGLPTVGAVAASAPAEHKATLGKVAKTIKMIGHAGLGLLLLTGILLASFGGIWSGAPVQFWIKLIAVAGLAVSIYVAGKAGARAMAGDAAAGATVRKLTMLNLALVVLIVLMAVLAFG